MSFYPGEKNPGAGSTSGNGRGRGRDLKTLANGRYRVMNLTGRGGMSVVYHAYDTLNDRDVAIKVLSLDLVIEESFLARFRRESELMRDLNHPNVLRAYDYGQEDDTVYLVMSYFGGGTLKEKMGSGPLPLVKINEYLAQIGAGLGYAHSRNIVHRDIKPSNMLIHHASETLVISDFGIAKALSSANSSRTGTIMGTPLYMAPEQFLDRVDQRSDIYSLGILLYQMLTGEIPFRGEGLGFQHLNDPLPPMSLFGVNYDSNIEAVVQKALAKRPEARYQSVEELVEGFRQATLDHAQNPTQDIKLPVITQQPAPDWSQQATFAFQRPPMLPGQDNFAPVPLIEQNVKPASSDSSRSYTPFTNYSYSPPNQLQTRTPTPAWQFDMPTQTPPGSLVVRNNSKKGWLLGGLIGLLVLGILGLIAGFILLQPNNSTSGNVLPRVITNPVAITTKTTIATTSPAPTPLVATTSAPTTQVVGLPAKNVKILFASHPTGKPDLTDIYFYDSQTGKLDQLTDSGRETLPAWSGNGRWILFQSYRNAPQSSIYQMSSDGKAQVLVVDRAKTPAAANQGNRIAYVSTEDEQIYTALAQGGPATAITRLTSLSGEKLGPVFSPDDSRLTWAGKDTNGLFQIWTLDLNKPNSTPQKLTNCLDVNCLWPSWSPDGKQIVYNTANKAVNDADRIPLEIWKFNADGTNPQVLVTYPKGGSSSHPIWIQDNRGPGGSRIYFNSDRTELARIFVMNPDGSDQKVFIQRDTPTEDFGPAILTY